MTNNDLWMDLTPALEAEYKFLKNEVRKREANGVRKIQELWAAKQALREFRLQLQKEGYKI